MAKPRVRSFTVHAAHGGYSVNVEHHPNPPQSGRGMKGLMGGIGSYVPPQEHVHTSKESLHKHLKSLADQMATGPVKESGVADSEAH